MIQSSKIDQNLERSVVSKQRQLAKRFGLDVVDDLSDFELVKQGESILPYSFAKTNLVLPLEKCGDIYTVAIFYVDKLSVLQEVKYFLGEKIKEVFVDQELIENAIEKCYHKSEGKASQYIEGLGEDSDQVESLNEESYDLLDSRSEAPVVKLLNMILIEAIQAKSSDIHFEPKEKSLVVRYRIDGVLHQRHTPPRELQAQLLTRIKVMGKLDIAEHRLPQDGRIKLMMAGRSIDFRVSTVPVAYGERIVLRILDKANIVLGLNRIGMPEETLKLFKKHISQSQGIVLVTGPTGSGKTTTLYSGISEIASPDVNIMTIEDPVEYKLDGMAQINVNPKINLDFAKGLRHILRQDPDVIMIGEIRDKETAEIAIQASLTGHLVLSTLHTNDAPSALTRLVDMGIEPYLLTSSIVAALAQRLVRKLCPDCKKLYVPTDEELKELGVKREDLVDGKLYHKVGCEKCFFSGYKGRHGIYELMTVSPSIKAQLLTSADAMQIQKVALSEGMLSLRSQGARLAIFGQTSSAEVLRVTRQVQLEE